MNPDRMIREKELHTIDGLKHTQRHEYIKRGIYPPPMKLSDAGRAGAWSGRELSAWQAWRRARRDGTAPEGSTWRDFLTVDGNDCQTVAETKRLGAQAWQRCIRRPGPGKENAGPHWRANPAKGISS